MSEGAHQLCTVGTGAGLGSEWRASQEEGWHVFTEVPGHASTEPYRRISGEGGP